MIKHCLFLLLFLLIFSACTEEKKNDDFKWTTEESTKMNKHFSVQEDLDINLYLSRKPEWKMTKTGTGLRYYIYENGSGETAQVDDVVDVEYTITLFDGTQCYATASDEVDEFKVDKAQIESGIQEAVKLMKEGDKAQLIVPSHLAYGIIGDMSKIPPLSPLVVDIKLVKIYRKTAP
ncbi:MAG TPA: FKBP-type peptidyl-prolyl cis-trans isomerase [Taishania sp.]|nr:FKBP-type peptidyl-prolyl cis-trans isomerase [Taishania sp.]